MVYDLPETDEEPAFTVSKDPDGMYVLSGQKIEKMFKMANLEYDESALRFARQLRRLGVDEALLANGAEDGDIVRILDYEFEFKI